jgi:hypothetical protein
MSLCFLPVAPNLDYRTSTKCFVSLQFLSRKNICRAPRTGDEPVARPLPTQDNRVKANIHALNMFRTHDPSV